MDNSSAVASKKIEETRPVKKCLSATELRKRSTSPDDDADIDPLTSKSILKLTYEQVADPNNTNSEMPKTADTNNEEKLKKQVAKSCVGKKFNKYVIEEIITSLVYRVSYQSSYYVANVSLIIFDSSLTNDLILVQWYNEGLYERREDFGELSDGFLKPVESLRTCDKLRCLMFPYVRPI